MKIVYCGYDFFSGCLEQLQANGHELIELFSYPTDNEYDFNENVFRIANNAGARITLSPIKIDDLDRFSLIGIDAIVVAAYPFRIPKWQGKVKYALNVHPSPLPVGRGPWPLPWLILKGASEGGVTIHEITSRLDAGDIISQEKFLLSDQETLESISARSQMLATRMIAEVFNDLPRHWGSRRPQGEGSYWPMPVKADRTIEWHYDVGQIETIVRAFSKFEPFLYINGVRHFVRNVAVWQEKHSHTPGEIVHRTSGEIVYAALDGYVSITNLKRADEK